jgi:hypothetical protein
MVITILFILMVVTGILLIKKIYGLSLFLALFISAGGLLFVFWDKIRFGHTLVLSWWDIGKLVAANIVIFACLCVRAGRKKKIVEKG